MKAAIIYCYKATHTVNKLQCLYFKIRVLVSKPISNQLHIGNSICKTVHFILTSENKVTNGSRQNNTQQSNFLHAAAEGTSGLYYWNIGFARMHSRLIAYIIMEYTHDIAVCLFVMQSGWNPPVKHHQTYISCIHLHRADAVTLVLISSLHKSSHIVTLLGSSMKS